MSGSWMVRSGARGADLPNGKSGWRERLRCAPGREPIGDPDCFRREVIEHLDIYTRIPPDMPELNKRSNWRGTALDFLRQRHPQALPQALGHLLRATKGPDTRRGATTRASWLSQSALRRNE